MDTVSTGKSETKDLFDHTSNGSAIEIKGSVFTLPVLKICTTDIDQVDKALKTHLAQSLSFFKNAPIVIDLERTKQMKPPMDFAALTALLRDQQLVPVAVQKGSLEQHLEAEKAGLAILTGQSSAKSKKTGGAVADNQPASGEADDSPAAESASATAVQPAPPVNAGTATTKMVTQPIRSGQRIYARDGDLIVLAAVNAGAEVMADGNIHIYAPLRGRALAGVKGNENARIFCHSMEAELIAIAGTYRVFEDQVPKEIHQQSVQICLRGEQLDIMPIQKP
ncbi:MAG: septum site-determining protein MinC [Gammaproteobacteria bacterium]|jgi:septum site-determining protein MinC